MLEKRTPNEPCNDSEEIVAVNKTPKSHLPQSPKTVFKLILIMPSVYSASDKLNVTFDIFFVVN